MKTLFATLAAATAVAAVAVPAAAQSYDRDGRYERSYDRDGRYERSYDGDGRYEQSDRWDRRHDVTRHEIDARRLQLNQRIEWGKRRGTIDRAEAARLYDQVRTINRLENRYLVGGLSRHEIADLVRRIDRLEFSIARESRDRDYGDNRYGRR